MIDQGDHSFDRVGFEKCDSLACDEASYQQIEAALAVVASRSPPGESDDTRRFLLDAALNHARIGVLHRDLDRRVIAVNDRFCEMVGRSAEALSGLTIQALMHPDDVAQSDAAYHEHLRRGTPFHIENRWLRPDGRIVWCALHVSFMRDAAGRAVSVVTVAQDITARRVAEDELRASEEHHRHSVALNPQISWTAAPDGVIDTVSPRWQDITGSDPREALGERWLAKVHPDDVSATTLAWKASIDTKLPVDVEYRLDTPGGFRWFRARAAAATDAGARVLRWYGTLEDIHDRKLAECAVRESEERFRLAAQAAGLGIWDYDATADRRDWSDGFKEMLGLPRTAEPSLANAFARVVPEDRHLLQAVLEGIQAGDGGQRFETTLRIRRKDTDAERVMQTSGWRIEAASGKLLRVLVTIRDVTEERSVEERIRWAATHDAMTRLPNRAYFGDRLGAAIAAAERSGQPLALVVFDVDHLKETNDTIGHDAGDVLLQTVAARLRETLGNACTLARLGGDEFAAVLEGVDEDGMKALVQRALTHLRRPFAYQDHIIDCQATAGGSTYPQNGTDAAELLKAADVALYAAKARGRGGVLSFKSEMRAGLQRRSSMINVARDAVREDRIAPFYQPKVRLGSDQVCGFEALLRWEHPLMGIQAPATIASAFDDHELAVALSDKMLERIVRDMRCWLDQGLDFGRMAVNLSTAEFRHESLVSRVLEHLHRAAIPTSRLELEVTETVFLGRGAENVAHALESFSRAGVKIALDDFGTGYASLTHLKAFPVDVIKIDRSFVSNLGSDVGDAAIIEAVVGLGHRLGMEVVAEGVETRAQARHLLDQGCDYGQGYLFSKAVAASEVPDMIRRSAAIPDAALLPRIDRHGQAGLAHRASR